MANYRGDEQDNVWGGTGEDEVARGFGGNDTLRGRGGDDYLIGGDGNDELAGGDGMDWAMYHDGGGVTVDLSAGWASRGVGPNRNEIDSLSSIENIFGSEQSDVMDGDGNANKLVGFDGHDTLRGGGGNDTLRGGDGDDMLMGEAGNDLLAGNQGMDTLEGGAGADRMAGGAANDVLVGGEGDDYLIGGGGKDKIKGGDFDIEAGTLGSDAGSDTAGYLYSDAAVKVSLATFTEMEVDDGDDTTDNEMIRIVSGAAALSGGQAVGDTLYGIENLAGSAHDDALTGDEMSNTLSGAQGNDTLMGDVIPAADAADRQATIGRAEANGDMLMGGQGDDVLIGGYGDDTLTGGAGADKIKGGHFDMTTMAHTDSGTGDTASYSSSNAGVTIDLSMAEDVEAGVRPSSDGPVLTLSDMAGGHASGDALYGIENLTGSKHADMLTGRDVEAGSVLDGGDGDDMLMGGMGNDTLMGGDGDDTLNPGRGSDMLEGNAGDDTFEGFAESVPDVDGDTVMVQSITGDDTIDGEGAKGAGMDTLDFFEVNGVTVQNAAQTVTFTLADTMSIERVIGSDEAANTLDASALTKSIELMGGDGADTLTGGMASDMIMTGAGGGTATGGMGDDTITGGKGNDNLLGDTATLDDSLAGADHLMGGDGDDTLMGHGGNDMLMGEGDADTLMGHGGDDMLMGGDGDDGLTGGAGNDTLSGGMDDDDLTGGAGDDTFVYMGGDDTITDFEILQRGGDAIDVSALNLTGAELDEMLGELPSAFADLDTRGTVEFDLSKARAGLAGTITLTNIDATEYAALNADHFILG